MVARWRSGLRHLSSNSVVAGLPRTQGLQEILSSATFLCDCVKVCVLKITVLAPIWLQCALLSLSVSDRNTVHMFINCKAHRVNLVCAI